MQQKQHNLHEEDSLVWGNFQQEKKESDSYLGEIFPSVGVTRSALDTKKARAGKTALDWDDLGAGFTGVVKII